MKRVGILFSDFGPYHVARIEALGDTLRKQGRELVAVRFTERSSTYGWQPVAPAGMETVTLAERYPAGAAEAARMAGRFLRELRQRDVGAVFLPTYSPLPNLLCFLAAKAAGCRTILMTESWFGTEDAGPLVKLAKHVLVRLFDAALVGGTPQRDYVAAYGMPGEKIFTGYDVVENEFFARQADAVRSAQKGRQEAVDGGQATGTGGLQAGDSPKANRRQEPEAGSSAPSPQQSDLASAIAALGLPERFFLNLGRFVEKKNLSTLVAAYGRYCDMLHVASDEKQSRAPVALVLVGEGPLRGDLERQAQELGLRVVDRSRVSPQSPVGSRPEESSGHAEDCKLSRGLGRRPLSNTANSVEQHGTVLFYGFHQSDMTPVFFALCEAFILPSSREEWGLVVNEAMTCGAPVLVSKRVGAGFDLVQDGVNGFRFEPDDVEGLAKLLGRFARDATLTAKLGRAGGEIVRAWGPEKFGRGGLRALNAAEGKTP